MEKMYDTANVQEEVILIGLDKEEGALSIDESLDELEELTNTAGAKVLGRLVQKRDRPHPGHYLGKGKVEELREMVENMAATGIICDDELSPAQQRNLETMLDIKVMDRTMLILDIFASRAVSAEGKLQVELAQLRYSLSHLTGMGKAMSRLGGGIGTRGPGEKKLETDRRYIRQRIGELSKELTEVETHRHTVRSSRKKNHMPVVSLVGYTNAGKSTLLNYCTGAGVLAEDKLFATLDTTTRQVVLPGGTQILLTDTVGFIQKLPHHLVKAFRATLEELTFADILIHVVDASNPVRSAQMAVVYKTLEDLKCQETPVITAFNKMDLAVDTPLPADVMARETIQLSAQTGEGIPQLLARIEALIKESKQPVTVLIPYDQGQMVSYLYGRCEMISEEHTAQGVRIQAYVDDELKQRFAAFEVKED